MNAQIGLATAEHRHGIKAVAAESLQASVNADSPHVQRLLAEGATFVATAEGRVVGFVSNFITCDGVGRRRFELDLMGVAPSWRGRGIGARLVDRSLQAARESSAITVRALVRCDNWPMQRVCDRHGFQRSHTAWQLLVSQTIEPAGDVGHDPAARVIAVDTLTYSGYWLEGQISRGAIDEGRRLLRAHTGRTQIGAVVPGHDRTTIDLLRANSFDRVGDFDWWTLSL